MSKAYDLKKSEKGIGQLYPILKSKNGKIIDGFHRQASDPNWKSMTLPEIDTEEKLLIARAVSNWHRRQVSREEKAEWINGLAEIYQKQGYKIPDKFPFENEIMQKLIDVTGLSQRTVNIYLLDEFKQKPRGGWSDETPRLVKEVAEHIRKQVLEEEKLSPKEKAKLKEEQQRNKEEREQKRILQKAKTLKAKELIKDKDFQREVIREISKPQIVKVTDPCPSGVCQLPKHMDAGPPLDITAIMIKEFWENYPQCQCEECEHYNECGTTARGIIKR